MFDMLGATFLSKDSDRYLLPMKIFAIQNSPSKITKMNKKKQKDRITTTIDEKKFESIKY